MMTVPRPATFPGTLRDARDCSLDSTVPDLRHEDLDAYPHHSL